jgi:UDP-N-acetylglucosamine 2-epimerase (non-hydrolysing)
VNAVTTVAHVVGARPNFMKMAPVIAALDAYGEITQRIVHTGQHYDPSMSAEILTDLGFPVPDVFLGVGPGHHGAQTGRALEAIERVLLDWRPDLVCVGGDVNSTLAAALAAAKLQVPLAHVESGLRSFDWTMPEEINRVVTDRLSDLLFTHSPECAGNLAAEGIDPARVHFVGNTTIDSVRRFERLAETRSPWLAAGVPRGTYALVTLHRPSNVDDFEQLRAVVDALRQLAAAMPVLFPLHPRTRSQLQRHGLADDLLGFEIGAGAIVTDSGGVQEEASALGVPCYTLRRNTERPVTITHGTNTLLGDDAAAIADIRLEQAARRPAAIEGWDGHAGERAACLLAEVLAPERVEALA